MKSTPELIVHSASRHFAQGKQRHPERRVAHLRVRCGTIVDMEKKIECDRARKFRSAAKATFPRIVTARDLLIGGIDQLCIHFPSAFRCRVGGPSQSSDNLV